MQQEIISFHCLKQFHSKKQLKWHYGIPHLVYLNGLRIKFALFTDNFFFFANCQTCKQKPGSESQAVFFLTYALPAAIKKKTQKIKPKKKTSKKSGS